MALGAVVVACAYILLAAVEWGSGEAKAPWLWFAMFFAIFTFGELLILPTGLGFFARLAPPRLGATTVATWFLATFAGSLSAGLVGMLWSHMDQGPFFAMLAALLLRSLDRTVRRVDPTWGAQGD